MLSLDSKHSVAVSTLGDCALPDILAERKPKGLSIVGKTETENIGIEKIIQNTLATPSLKYLILCGAKEKDPDKVKLDRAGYFVIIPKAEQGIILVEHYNYANQLLRVIQGDNARDIYWTIIENNWVGEMSHAAYLGKELTAAQLSMQMGFKYVQDKA